MYSGVRSSDMLLDATSPQPSRSKIIVIGSAPCLKREVVRGWVKELVEGASKTVGTRRS
jgi:hypothetical protein